MSSSSDSAAKSASMKPTKVVIPKVWKRPHSTIYGKNVEFGSKLYSDKLGEINGRKFNSDLPWQMRNSGSTNYSANSVGSQGYLSKLLNEPESSLIGSVVRAGPAVSSYQAGYQVDYLDSGSGGAMATTTTRQQQQAIDESRLDRMMREDRANQLNAAKCENFADVLEVTNPHRYSKRRRDNQVSAAARRQKFNSGPEARQPRIDFFQNYLDFNQEISRVRDSSRLFNDPLIARRTFDKNLDFDYELGLFMPSAANSADLVAGQGLARKRTLQRYEQQLEAGHIAAAVPHLKHAQCQDDSNHQYHPHARDELSDVNNSQYLFNPVLTTTKQTQLLPRHHCQLADSPYGQSADGRKLSLGSINPHSYRPSLPHKNSTVHASDGEEFEFQDKSSPFYTDR